MAKKKSENIQQYKFKAEMKQLLHLIVHSLYTHPEIFLRELISNASDALHKIRFRMLTDKEVRDPDADLKITIELDEKKQLFTIEDTGIGMTRDDLINRLGSVASSGTLELIQQLKDAGKEELGDLIGRFGVGFYSVFMVTDEVTVETRHADKDSVGLRWASKGEGTFTIEEIDRKSRGTKITFKLKDDYKHYSEAFTVKHIIKKYSNFVDFPIYIGKEKVNTVTALWQKPKDQQKEEELVEFYKFISNDSEPPLGHLYLNIEGAVNFKALIFIPQMAPLYLFSREAFEKSLHLYAEKVFIQDDCKELLPEYLRFVKGVVDTPDLPLNVSREVTQSSPAMAKIRNILTSKILSFLEDWSKNEQKKFEKFYKNFGPLFKTGLNSDFANRDKIMELLRFESTKTTGGAFTSLRDYVSRMKEDQKEIYYVTGETREQAERNPNLEYFKKNDIEVLLLTDPVDIFLVPSINEYDKKPLKSIEKADIDFKASENGKAEALNPELAKSLISVFKETLGDKVEDVIESRRLVDSPVTLVVGKDGLDPQMEKMMKMMNKEYTGQKRILEINTTHPLIKNLSRLNLVSSTHPLLRKCILQLYEGAALVEGTLTSPTEFVSRMTEIMTEATKAAE